MFNKSKKPRYANREEKEENIVQKTIEWICMDLQPLSTIESDYFRELMLVNNPEYKVLGRKGAIKRLYILEDEIRTFILELIQTNDPWFSVTVDHWTSIANQNYTGMTIHWIGEDGVLNNIQLGCWLHEGNSESETLIDDFVSKLFEKCQLTTAKISAVVSDTTANMNLFGELLEKQNIPHIYCTDHVIQCTAKMAFKDRNFFYDVDHNNNIYNEHQQNQSEKFKLMEKCRKLVEIFSKSCQKQDLLLQQQSKMGIYKNKQPLKTVADVCTRWWSTYSMLSRLLYLKPAIVGLSVDNLLPMDKCLTENEWMVVMDIIEILKPFKMAQKHLEGEKYVTISFIPLMIENIEKRLKSYLLCPQSNDNVKELVQRMINDHQIRWGKDHMQKFNSTVLRGNRNRQVGLHPIVVLSTALDPRLKNLTFLHDDEEKNCVWAYVLENMMDIAKTSIQNQDYPITNSSNSEHGVNCDLDSDTEDFFDEIHHSQNIPTNNENETNNHNSEHLRLVCQQELSSYQQHKLLEIYAINEGKKTINCPLKKFWIQKKGQFPILYMLAMKYLCIPATSAPSERVFSTASRIISKFRNRINHDTAGSILFVNGSLEWYKKNVSEKE